MRWLAMLNIGVAYREIQEHRKSFEWLNKALSWISDYSKQASFHGAWDSEFVATYYELGNLLKVFGDKSKSEEYYLLGMRIAENSKSTNQELLEDEILIWLSLGELYIQMERLSEAEIQIKKCLQRNPENKYFQFLLGNAQNRKP